MANTVKVGKTVKKNTTVEQPEIMRGSFDRGASEKKVSEKMVGKVGYSLNTTRSVVFNIDGVKYEGTHFDMESEEVLEDRKQMLIASYGADIINK